VVAWGVSRAAWWVVFGDEVVGTRSCQVMGVRGKMTTRRPASEGPGGASRLGTFTVGPVVVVLSVSRVFRK